MRGYGRVLDWSTRHHYITVGLGLVLFVLALLSTRLLPSGFLPAQDVGRSVLAIELAPGSSLAATEAVTESIATQLRQRPEVKSVFVDGGRLPPAVSEVRVASLIINYTPKHDRETTQRELELSIGRDLEQIPDIRHWFLDENGMRGVALVVTGQDGNVVRNVAGELATQMRRIPIISDVVSSASLDRPELRVRPRPYLAARLGMTTEGLSETLRIATIGDVEPALAKMSAGERQVPIRVQLDDTVRADRQKLAQLRVPLPGGRGSVPLDAIADVALEEGPINITRYDRERQAGVGADLVGTTVIGEAMAEIDKLPVMQHLPPGVEVRQSGDAESMKDLADGFTSAMRDGLMMVFAVLVLLFGGIFQPITILFSLPLSVGGAFVGLLVTHRALSVPVFIGILMLMGIVTKNAIMLVDFTILAIREGTPRVLAAVDAGRKRARPIVMTTVAMVAGMLPSAFAHGVGGRNQVAHGDRGDRRPGRLDAFCRWSSCRRCSWRWTTCRASSGGSCPRSSPRTRPPRVPPRQTRRSSSSENRYDDAAYPGPAPPWALANASRSADCASGSRAWFPLWGQPPTRPTLRGWRCPWFRSDDNACMTSCPHPASSCRCTKPRCAPTGMG